MRTLPANIYSVAAVREIDRTAIEDHGIPGYTLMTRAGAASVRAARQRFPDAKRWQVVCGGGNNGGDGYVVARLAANEGIAVSVLTLVDPQALRRDAAKAYGDFAAEGGVVMPWDGELDAEAELLVDAILGSGLERDLGGEYGKAVAAINDHAAKVLSLDIPTGINGDSGKLLGSAVRADLTVTFVGLKTGLFVDRGAEFCGELQYDGLEIPDEYRANVSTDFRRVDDALMRSAFPVRRRTAHKGDFGHVLVIGGGEGMPGAVRLCGEAALRAGAGLVSIATAPSHAAILAATRPELMSHAIEGPEDLEALLEKADVIAFGPGLGLSDWAEALFETVVADARPAVWDADALKLLADRPGTSETRIITPHPGEAGRLLERPTADVQADRPGAVRALQKRYGGVAVLKGAGTLIATGTESPSICTSGNPGMAAAGMGDVLTGIVAALLGQGLSAEQAALAGVEAHARAGDIAASGGERGLIASDLIAALRGVINP
ncbi:MAG: NAD(P)H-hydrate dehydratase [Gammaproteobacteria bacterium]|nr:NAD(P)H-hydrate dehydratase [Gammaproteobacteria bacterium]